ncbi:pyrimidine reductase family protein [Rhodococcus sp. MEB064]|uniref:pyrimidine reductase family protein n=1 Tax=Rhodococcus sp. MEB064 TaxID=1587522 RepID=UPI0009E20F62|nr:pyrimidine reductase family protein [Rhodococcus sp. MEB064]
MQRIDNGTYLTVNSDDLVELYAYPTDPGTPWIRVNFVVSIDGAVSQDGVSGGLGTDADKTVFAALRGLADAVLVGSGTVSAENYGGVVVSDEVRAARVARGQQPVPPVVVVTGSANVDPTAAVVTDAEVPPIVLTTSDAPEDRVRALTDAGVTVVRGGETLSGHAVKSMLDELGLYRVLCEGGPGLFGSLLEADVVDELCITTSPTMAAGSAGRVSTSDSAVDRPMLPAHILVDDDGTMLVRWVSNRTS